MKKDFIIGLISLFFVLGIGGCKSSDRQEEFVFIDAAVTHPEKELVLQDFMDVEYIPLETSDEFLTQGSVMAIGDKYVIVKNWIQDGTIFVFDRKTGKGIRKINRKGQGAEEYTYINNIILNEEQDEIFVNSSSLKKIQVYDLLGNFKRTLKHAEGMKYIDIFDYDKDHLICYDLSGSDKDGQSKGDQCFHMILSKKDGSITHNISIPFDVIRAPVVTDGEGFAASLVSSIIPYQDDFFLVETSSDTVYRYVCKEKKLLPFVVRKPSVDPVVFLTMGVVTDRYYFMRRIKRIFDFSKGRGFPYTELVYDKEEKKTFEVNVLNGDFTKKKRVELTSKPISSSVPVIQRLAADQLIEAYEKNELKGRLKEIAAGLEEDANPVVMLVKYKK